MPLSKRQVYSPASKRGQTTSCAMLATLTGGDVAAELQAYMQRTVTLGRKRLGYTREQFAEKVGMTPEAIRLFESGKVRLPRDKNWIKMLRIVTLSPEAVMSAYMRGTPPEALVLSIKIEQLPLKFNEKK